MQFKTGLLSAAALIAAGALGYSVTASSSAQFEPALSSDKTKIEAIVREYILENPELIAEALDIYAEKEAVYEQARLEESLVGHLPSLLDDKDGYTAGAKAGAAKVAVIELFDYHCGYCKEASNYVFDLIKEEKDVQVVFRELPIMREESTYAAEVALASRDQGKYRDLHFALMQASGVLTEDRIDKIAKNAGVNLVSLHSTRKNSSYDETLDKTREIAIDIRLTGTPAFIVASPDGSYTRLIPGWAPEEIDEAIKEARKAAG